jgi:hypothetical protein
MKLLKTICNIAQRQDSILKSQIREEGVVVSSLGEVGNGELVFGSEFQFEMNKNMLGMDSGKGCTTT